MGNMAFVSFASEFNNFPDIPYEKGSDSLDYVILIAITTASYA